jgi:hypothetical protein
MKRERLALLLAADVEELRGKGGSEAARLVRQDAEFREHAAAILRDQGKLNQALSELALQPSGKASARNTAMPGRWTRQRKITIGRSRRWAVVSVGAAALLTLLVARPASPPERSAEDERQMTRRLDAASDRPFAVIATDNPNIAIVWLFEEEER